MDPGYGVSSLPSGPPPPPPSSSPPPSHINDHIPSGGGSVESNQHASTSQSHHPQQQQIRIPLVNPVAPLNTRESHVPSIHATSAIPLPSVAPGSSR